DFTGSNSNSKAVLELPNLLDLCNLVVAWISLVPSPKGKSHTRVDISNMALNSGHHRGDSSKALGEGLLFLRVFRETRIRHHPRPLCGCTKQADKVAILVERHNGRWQLAQILCHRASRKS